MWTTEPINPSLIENTTMERGINGEGEHKTYLITPIDGYVLHDKNYDIPVLDEITLEETGEIRPGYRTSTASCAANYDFEANPREFYAVPADSVPVDQIFGVTPGGNHEVM